MSWYHKLTGAISTFYTGRLALKSVIKVPRLLYFASFNSAERQTDKQTDILTL